MRTPNYLPVVDNRGFLLYYNYMVRFDGAQTQALIKRLTTLKGITLTAFLIAFCCGMIAAGATPHIDEYAATVIALFVIAGVAAACFATLLIPLTLTRRKIDANVSSTLAAAMYKNEDMLTDAKGVSEIAFVAAYSGDRLTFGRADRTDGIIFDLTVIKKCTSVYSAFGTRLTEFLEAFYSVRHKDGVRVTVTEDMGGRRKALDIAGENGVKFISKNNYFIKRGLIK